MLLVLTVLCLLLHLVLPCSYSNHFKPFLCGSCTQQTDMKNRNLDIQTGAGSYFKQLTIPSKQQKEGERERRGFYLTLYHIFIFTLNV